MSKSKTLKTMVAAFAVASITGAAAHAAVITSFDFNSTPSDGSVTTGTTVADSGPGTAALIGGTTATFATGTPADPENLPVSNNNSGWNTTDYPAATAGNKTAGVEFSVDTSGFEDIVLAFEHRHSNTASRMFRIQYSTDGTSFVDASSYNAAGSENFFIPRGEDFSAITGLDDNPLVKFRIVAEFTGAGAYEATRTSSPTTYTASGTNRFDIVSISGTAIPEPAGMAMLGLIGAGLVARRRR